MGKITDSINKTGNFVLIEQWADKNFCRNQISVDTFRTGGGAIESGEVVYRDAANKAAMFARPSTANALPATIQVAIVSDARVQDAQFINHAVDVGWGTNPPDMGQQVIDWSGTEHVEVSLGAITRGDCMIREGGLTFGNLPLTDVKVTTLKAALEAQGIRLVPYAKGLFGVNHPLD